MPYVAGVRPVCPVGVVRDDYSRDASRFQYPVDFLEKAIDVMEVFDDVAQDNFVEMVVSEG